MSKDTSESEEIDLDLAEILRDFAAENDGIDDESILFLDQIPVDNNDDSIVSMFLNKVNGKKNKKQRVSLPSLIVRSDIRESYPQMLLNALNTSNFTIIQSFFTHFSGPGVVCYMKRLMPDQTTTFVKEFCGPTAVANLLYTSIALAPDALLKLKSSAFHSGAINEPVSFMFKFYMTKVYNVASIHEVLPNMMVEKTTDGSPISEKDMNEDNIMKTLDSLKGSVSLRKTPIQCSYNVKVLMLTDPNSKICTQIGLSVEQKTGCFSSEK